MQTDTEKNVRLRIAGITDDSIVDGPGIRLTVFVQGCPHNCDGCHNPQTHDFSAGTDITLGEIMDRINANPLLDGVT
ncbi:MAG: 4Fe-4S cluster-binding domain-containing protein, partial [Huintestinicola sp.]